jgi:hypothetical protein
MTDIITQLQNAEAAKQKALSKLHAELGYPSAQALADAILSVAGSTAVVVTGTSAAKAATSKPAATSKTTAAAKGLGKGRRVPDSVRA